MQFVVSAVSNTVNRLRSNTRKQVFVDETKDEGEITKTYFDYLKDPGELFPRSTWSVWTDRIYQFFDNPSSSPLALAWSLGILGLILLTTVSFIVQSMPEYYSDPPKALFVIDTFCIIIFTVEYVMRAITCPSKWNFIFDIMNTVDLLTIVPYYVEVSSSSDSSSFVVLRVVRLSRVFRVLKMGRYGDGFLLVSRALKKSVDAVFLLIFFVSIGIVLFSSLMFNAEQSEEYWDEDTNVWRYHEGDVESPFQSIIHTFWWCVITITTVGYGDTFPITKWGKVVGAATIVCGILILAFPITILGTKVGEVYEKLRQEKDMAAFQKQHENQSHSENLEMIDEMCERLDEAIAAAEQSLQELKRKRENFHSSIKDLKEQYDKAVKEDRATKEQAIHITQTSSPHNTTTGKDELEMVHPLSPENNKKYVFEQ